MPQMKWKISNFGYGVNFKHEGMLSHSFDRFYVVAKFELPRVEDLKLTTIEFDSKCTYLGRSDTQLASYFPKGFLYCLKIVPYVKLYKKQIEYSNCTAYEILTNDIGLILTTFQKEKRPKRGILPSVLGGIASSVISLAYKDIPSFFTP